LDFYRPQTVRVLFYIKFNADMQTDLMPTRNFNVAFKFQGKTNRIYVP